MDSIIETYLAPNRTVADLREIVKGGRGVDPLKDFSEAAREELHACAPVYAAVSANGQSRIAAIRARRPVVGGPGGGVGLGGW